MVDQNTDFFQIVDNFAKTKHIQSIPIVKAKLDFVPKVTIAIPTYKRPSLLKEAIDSAINQFDYFDYEIVIVDNDPERESETEKLIISYYKCDRLSYYKNVENIGMFANWNRCIELAKGEFITILNDDDLLHKNYLKVVTEFTKTKNNVDVLFVGAYIIKNEEIQKKNTLPKFCKVKKLFLIDFLFSSINHGTLGAFLKKERAIKTGGFNELFYPTSDYVFWVNFILNFKNIFKITNNLCYYRLSVNESLNTNVQIMNLKNDKLLRTQLADKIPLLKPFIRLSFLILDYKQMERVCDFSREINLIYRREIKNMKEKVSLMNSLSYFVLIFTQKMLSKFSELLILRHRKALKTLLYTDNHF